MAAPLASPARPSKPTGRTNQGVTQMKKFLYGITILLLTAGLAVAQQSSTTDPNSAPSASQSQTQTPAPDQSQSSQHSNAPAGNPDQGAAQQTAPSGTASSTPDMSGANGGQQSRSEERRVGKECRR